MGRTSSEATVLRAVRRESPGGLSRRPMRKASACGPHDGQDTVCGSKVLASAS